MSLSTSNAAARAKVPSVVSVRRSARDREFLPAALAIVETPPSPVQTALLFLICLLFAAAILWSWFGRIDVVSVAPGKVQPEGRVKTVQSVETGRVNRIVATNGMHVAAGAVLFTLDPAESLADEAQFSFEAASFRAEALRRRTAVASARDTTVPKIQWPDGIPGEIARAQEHALDSQLAQLRADIRNLAAQLDEKRAEEKRLDLTIAAQSTLVSTLKERVAMRSSLLDSGSGPKAAVLDARENYETQAANLAYQTGQRGESEAAIAVASTGIEKAYQTFIADNEEKGAEAERQAEDYAHKLATAEVKSAHLTVVAPVDGIVQGSTVTTDGQVVSLGEEVMRIVPATGDLEVEAYLSNKDVGFVRPGQDVVIKVESFPFTRYGTLKGTVERVAPDAIATVDANLSAAAPARPIRGSGVAGAQQMQDLVFPMTVKLAARSIKADGQTVPLTAGMAVSADVRTGSRRVIDYLLSPVMEVAESSLRER